MSASRKDQKIFFLRLFVVVSCTVLVMYLAKIWFFTQERQAIYKGSTKPKLISWRDADRHLGEYVIVEGRIVATHNTGTICFLNFHPNYKRYLTAVIFSSSFHLFPKDPHIYYYGKKVRIKGHIEEYKGRPEIVIKSPDQIQVLE